MPTTDLAIAACCLFYVAFTVFAAGFVGWICERQQPRRTVHIDPLAGEFVDVPTEDFDFVVSRLPVSRRLGEPSAFEREARKKIPDVVRRQGAAQQQIDELNEWRVEHELGRQSQWWADELRHVGEPVA